MLRGPLDRELCSVNITESGKTVKPKEELQRGKRDKDRRAPKMISPPQLFCG